MRKLPRAQWIRIRDWITIGALVVAIGLAIANAGWEPLAICWVVALELTIMNEGDLKREVKELERRCQPR